MDLGKFMLKKQRMVLDRIEEYLEQLDRCVEQFRKCMEQLVSKEISPADDDIVNLVHKAESKADDLRRAIELELYQKALIPESRGDVLGIIETIDRIPNLLESICYQIHLQNITIPEELRKDFFHLIDVNLATYAILKEAVIGFFCKGKVLDKIRTVDAKESESDALERKLIRQVFNSGLEKADKILLKEIIINIGSISDEAETVSDRLTLAIVKRRI